VIHGVSSLDVSAVEPVYGSFHTTGALFIFRGEKFMRRNNSLGAAVPTVYSVSARA
jgi:hypothetical protein